MDSPHIMSLRLILCVIFIEQLSWAQQRVPSSASGVNQASASVTTTANNSVSAAASAVATSNPTLQQVSSGSSEDLKRFEEYKKSPYFVEPFDPKVLSLPDAHLAFVRQVTRDDIVFYRTILNEAIAMRNKIAASVRLMLKYSGKLMSTFIRNRRDERKLTNRVEPKPEFYLMLADLSQAVMDQSGQLKRNYSKNTIDIEYFRSRVVTLFDTIQQIVDTSPMGAYMKWNQLILYKDFPRNGIQNRSFIEETADVTGQFRAMGYESTSFVIRRIINMLKIFARGNVPSSEKEV